MSKHKKILLGLTLVGTLFCTQSVFAADNSVELTLNEVVQKVFQNEPRVDMAKADVLGSKGALRQAWGANGLNISYNYNATRLSTALQWDV